MAFFLCPQPALLQCRGAGAEVPAPTGWRVDETRLLRLQAPLSFYAPTPSFGYIHPARRGKTPWLSLRIPILASPIPGSFSLPVPRQALHQVSSYLWRVGRGPGGGAGADLERWPHPQGAGQVGRANEAGGSPLGDGCRQRRSLPTSPLRPAWV